MKKQGEVKYLYEYGNGNIGKPKSLMFYTPGTKIVTLSRMFYKPEKGRVRIRIISPVNVNSNWAAYELKHPVVLSKDKITKPSGLKRIIKPKQAIKPRFRIKNIQEWKILTKVKLPDLVIQKFKTVGTAGYLNSVTRFEVVVANIGNVSSAECELGIKMKPPDAYNDCPGCTYKYDIPVLEPGTSCTIEAAWSFPEGPGLWRFDAFADWKYLNGKGIVQEIKEDNNKASTFVIMHH